jgi:hypothetical protein
MQINLLAAWVGILLGFLSGLALGLFFHREDWLGGYGSFTRRLYRLAHISFFGLGAVNLFFYFTARMFPGNALIPLASSAFLAGAITMPVCCIIMAHFPNTHSLFALPVLSLVAGGVLTIAAICSGGNVPVLNQQLSTLTQP